MEWAHAWSRSRSAAAGALVLACAACAGDSFEPFGERDLPVCSLDESLLHSNLPADAIPSLIQPDMVTIGAPGSEYLLDSDRVLGVVIDGEPRAYPHNILWHHEIVSDRVGDRWVTATYCPLTGSGLVFDPHLAGERLDIGVSGLLFANNLVLYDRTSGDVYGPQLAVGGTCSRFRDQQLELLPVIETSWGQWRRLHQNTTVVSSNTGFSRDYRESPYEGYDELSNEELLYPMPVDASRPIKERVLAIRLGTGGVGYPFGELAAGGPSAAVNDTVASRPIVVFYEARDGETAIAFDAVVEGDTLSFDPGAAGEWTDRETGSTWAIDGTAVAGPLRGARLDARADAFVVFWFAWRHFQPDAFVWTR